MTPLWDDMRSEIKRNLIRFAYSQQTYSLQQVLTEYRVIIVVPLINEEIISRLSRRPSPLPTSNLHRRT